jgi:hypothetical protein
LSNRNATSVLENGGRNRKWARCFHWLAQKRHGLVVERTDTGRIRTFDLEQFEKLSKRYRDHAYDQRPKDYRHRAELDEPPADATDESLSEAQRQRAWMDVEARKSS